MPRIDKYEKAIYHIVNKLQAHERGGEMNDERKRILEMVSDGTITPSEGARLLDALGSSGRGRGPGRQAGKKDPGGSLRHAF